MADIGYLRYDINRQVEQDAEVALAKACRAVYKDIVNSKDTRRPELNRMLSILAGGDVLHIRTLLDLGGSTRDLLQIVDVLIEKGVELVSIKEGIDTRSHGGKVIYDVFSLLSMLDKEAIEEWEKKYIESAKKRTKRY